MEDSNNFNCVDSYVQIIKRYTLCKACLRASAIDEACDWVSFSVPDTSSINCCCSVKSPRVVNDCILNFRSSAIDQACDLVSFSVPDTSSINCCCSVKSPRVVNDCILNFGIQEIRCSTQPALRGLEIFP